MSALTARGSTRRWRRIRAWVLNRDGWRCQWPGDAPATPGSWAATHGRLWSRVCGAYADHVDHVDRREHAGSDAPANLRAACEPHNTGRGDRDDAQLLADYLAGKATHTTTRAPARRWAW